MIGKLSVVFLVCIIEFVKVMLMFLFIKKNIKEEWFFKNYSVLNFFCLV